MSYGYDVKGTGAYVQVTTTSTVSTIVAPSNAVGCLLSVDTTDARVTFDGSSPSSSLGMLVKNGQPYPWYVPVGKTIKYCSTSTTVAAMNVTWLSD